jgi:hypothetical protein
VVCIGTVNNGISFSSCIRPRVINGGAVDCNDTALGYGVLFTECRDMKSDGFSTRNCRAGVDCSGTIKSVGALIRGGSMIGGYADADDLPWDEDNTNRGPGDHGQSLDWVYDGVTIEGMITHCVQRGTNVAFRNLRHLGRPLGAYYLLEAGYGTTIIGHDVSPRMDITQESMAADPEEYSGNFIRLRSAKYGGNLYVGPGNVQGLTNAFIKTTTGSPRGPVRVDKQNLSVRRMDAGITYFVEAESGSFIPDGWSIERPDVYMMPGGTGTFQLLSGVTLGTAPVKMKIGATWAVAIADDAVIPIPVYGDHTITSQVQLIMFERANSATYKCNAILRRNSATFSGTNFGGIAANIEAMATVPVAGVVGGTDGSLIFHFDGAFVYIKNRTAAQRELMIKIEGF